MTFYLLIEMDNAAFEDGPKDELLDCLSRVKDAIRMRGVGCGLRGQVRDINGNQVGGWRIDAEKEDE